MLQRYSSFLSSALALVFVGTLFSLFWAYSASEERSLLEIQKKYFQALKPDNPEYRAFYNNYQSFHRRKEEQQERLRQIQKRIEADPRSVVLKRELATYHAWLKTVSPNEQSRINQEKTIDARLATIRDVKEDQDRIQGISERKSMRVDPETINLFPTIYELADYLEFLESHNPARWETLLGHTPDNFLYQLRQDYHAEVE